MVGIYNKLIFDAGSSTYIFVKELKEDDIILYINSKKIVHKYIEKDGNILMSIPSTMLFVVKDFDERKIKTDIVVEIYGLIEEEILSGKPQENYEKIINKLMLITNE